MNYTPLFPTIVFDEKTSKIDNEKISKIILEREKTISTIEISNYGGWQSEHYNEDDDFKEIIDFAEKTFKEIYKEFYTEEGSFYIDKYWLSVNRYRDFNHNHIHPGSDWSFTYYVSTPADSGNIVFVDPRIRRMGRQAPLSKQNNYFSHDQFYVLAEEGLIVFFPGYLEHYVQPNETKKPRISLSGNINLKI